VLSSDESEPALSDKSKDSELDLSEDVESLLDSSEERVIPAETPLNCNYKISL
jgi:hypothetical protein